MKLNTKELDHLKRVIDYLYSDERRDYENEGSPADHIFVSVLGLQEILWRGSPFVLDKLSNSTVAQPIPETPSSAPDLHLVTD